MIRLGIVVFIVISSLTTATFARQTWHEITSDHFILRTDAKLEKAQQTIIDLEKFRFTLSVLTGLDLSTDHTPPLVIYAFRKTRTFQKQLKAGDNTSGFYYQPADGSGAIAALSLEDGKEVWQFKGIQILFHEYSHHVLHHYSPYRYPKWYDEGFGEYLSTMTFEGKTAKVGMPIVPRFLDLQNTRNWVRIEEVIRARAIYPERARTLRGKSVDAIAALYAQGWLLTHYMLSTDGYKKPLSAYMRAINEPGVDDDIAFQNAFRKSYSEIETELLDYWGGKSLKYLTYDLSDSMPDFTFKTRKMPRAEAKIQHEEIKYLTEARGMKYAKAKKAFERAVGDNIRLNDMRRYLAEIALGEDKPVVAEKYLNAILAENPNDAAALQLRARVFINGGDLGKLPPEQLTEYQSRIGAALEADANYVPALLDYAQVFLVDSIEVTQDALNAIETARKLAPDNDQAKSFHIALLWKSGDLAKARYHAQTLIDWSESYEARAYYQNVYTPLLDAALE